MCVCVVVLFCLKYFEIRFSVGIENVYKKMKAPAKEHKFYEKKKKPSNPNSFKRQLRCADKMVYNTSFRPFETGMHDNQKKRTKKKPHKKWFKEKLSSLAKLFHLLSSFYWRGRSVLLLSFDGTAIFMMRKQVSSNDVLVLFRFAFVRVNWMEKEACIDKLKQKTTHSTLKP